MVETMINAFFYVRLLWGRDDQNKQKKRRSFDLRSKAAALGWRFVRM